MPDPTTYRVHGPKGTLVYEGDLETALEYVDDERFARGWTVVPSRCVIRSMEQMRASAAQAEKAATPEFRSFLEQRAKEGW